jgi:hypothetical protein
MSKQNKILNNLIFLSAALAFPYIYYFTLRPRLLDYEKKLDDKMTDIKDDQFEKMKKKMENLKSDNK